MWRVETWEVTPVPWHRAIAVLAEPDTATRPQQASMVVFLTVLHEAVVAYCRSLL